MTEMFGKEFPISEEEWGRFGDKAKLAHYRAAQRMIRKLLEEVREQGADKGADKKVWVITKQEDEVGGYMGSGSGPLIIMGASLDEKSALLATEKMQETRGNMRWISYRAVPLEALDSEGLLALVAKELEG